MKITVDLDLEDIIDEARLNEVSFKEEFSDALKTSAVYELKRQCKEAVIEQITKPVKERVEEVVREISKEILDSDFRTREFDFKIGYEAPKAMTIEALVQSIMSIYMRREIEDNIQRTAKSVAEDLKKRYDLAFAALIVDNMRRQKLLADDRLADLLKPSQSDYSKLADIGKE